jgi:acetyl-CoA/propionyl-CoA carboxylase biotin carboxyl carrier protein
MRVLVVAGRGERAAELLTTCRTAGLTGVFAHCGCRHCARPAREAGEAYRVADCQGPAALLEAADRFGVDAVHPGGGPLAASTEFFRSVLSWFLIWAGPVPETCTGSRHHAVVVPVGRPPWSPAQADAARERLAPLLPTAVGSGPPPVMMVDPGILCAGNHGRASGPFCGVPACGWGDRGRCRRR